MRVKQLTLIVWNLLSYTKFFHEKLAKDFFFFFYYKLLVIPISFYFFFALFQDLCSLVSYPGHPNIVEVLILCRGYSQHIVSPTDIMLKDKIQAVLNLILMIML